MYEPAQRARVEHPHAHAQAGHETESNDNAQHGEHGETDCVGIEQAAHAVAGFEKRNRCGDLDEGRSKAEGGCQAHALESTLDRRERRAQVGCGEQQQAAP